MNFLIQRKACEMKKYNLAIKLFFYSSILASSSCAAIWAICIILTSGSSLSGHPLIECSILIALSVILFKLSRRVYRLDSKLQSSFSRNRRWFYFPSYVFLAIGVNALQPIFGYNTMLGISNMIILGIAIYIITIYFKDKFSKKPTINGNNGS